MADKTLLDREEQAGRGKRRIAGGAGRPGGAPGDSHVSVLINGALPTEPLASSLPGVTSSQVVTNCNRTLCTSLGQYTRVRKTVTATNPEVSCNNILGSKRSTKQIAVGSSLFLSDKYMYSPREFNTSLQQWGCQKTRDTFSVFLTTFIHIKDKDQSMSCCPF